MMEGCLRLQFICQECKYETFSHIEMSAHTKEKHAFQTEFSALTSVGTALLPNPEPPAQNENSTIESVETVDKNKLWNKDSTLLLINLVEHHEEDLNKKVKKYVWEEIAKTINLNIPGGQLTWLQCDTKWKGLIKTYKEVKKHNETSGKNIRKWEYFEIMHKFLFKRPEITPVATCSARSGLMINTGLNTSRDTDCVEISYEEPEASTSSNTPPEPSYQSNFMRQRKQQNTLAQRHKDKMQRQDIYLELLERLVRVQEKRSNVHTASSDESD